MKNMSIKSLSFIILIFIAIYGAAVVFSALTISHKTDEADRFWIEYQDISSARASAFTSIVKALGYGGMIHQFSDYLLHKDEPRIARVRIAAGKVIASVDKYSETTITPSERNALRKIKEMVQTYAGKLTTAEKMAEEGYSSRQIDKVTRLDDSPALSSLDVLSNAVQKNRLRGDARASKGELLHEIHRALGYGGLIHHYKSYVLRQDKKRIAKIRRGIADVQGALDRYRAYSLVPAEDLALKSLGDVIAQYKRNLDLAIKLAGEGKAPEEIDWRVKIDDNPALSSLRILSLENSKVIAVSKRRTSEQLLNSVNLARLIAVGSVIGLLLLILLIAYVLFSHVLGPVNKITKSLATFIEGDLNVEFYGTERKDELGYLAQIIDKMRVILIGYALRQSGGQGPET